MQTAMEDRIKQLISEEDSGTDTFADRADAYYRRRPRLMALLHDLYNDYVTLADRYARALTKLAHANNSPIATTVTSFSVNDEGCVSDAESTLTSSSLSIPYKQPNSKRSFTLSAADGGGGGGGGWGCDVVAELVVKSVEYDFLEQEMEMAGRESCRKIELQKSLLEVLESERMVLLGENSRLGYRAEMLAEEKKAAEAENAFLRNRSNQLARCVMSYQEDRRAAVLSRQIEDLQRQIYALERKNKDNVLLFTPPQVTVAEHSLREGGGGEGRKRKSSWWSRLKKSIGAANPSGSCSGPVHVIQL
ncbi:hypothetical protein QQ045_033438 [Rhodiola kirilowii]